jgi:hypothetical protein
MRIDSRFREVFSMLAVLALAATVSAQPKTVGQETVKGTPNVKTQQLEGTVVVARSDMLLVKLASGAYGLFYPPPDRKFIIDGKELTVNELQPGTRLKATYTETTTPVTVRTVQTLTGKVFYAAPPTIILTLENGQNKMYTVESGSPVKFVDSSGKEMTVFDLRKDMTVTATKIIEAPRTEFTTATVITGTVPKS